ncbi:RibD family protein [Cyanobacterium aponinum FACHB-4101]|uniref:RibD family protein n=1 Tax=Cyanobacterium aponinum TaxID=379064 RepID=UPI00167FFDE2|nr:RibD family protein [Cyanobacterium aponinum]MBD2392927.1 RibD family protein [Cyanobacterium aponinum FACHB-4101]
MTNRSKPHITAIIATSLNGKISTDVNTRAKFTSVNDFHHLETQVSLCDAVIFGANTLRAYGTSLSIKDPKLIKERQARHQQPQPLHIVCSPSGNLKPDWAFFSQPIPRGLITTKEGLNTWHENINTFPNCNNDIQYSSKEGEKSYFQNIFISESSIINWHFILDNLQNMNINKIAILGGEKLITSFLKDKLIDDLWITICPLLILNSKAPNFCSTFLDENMHSIISLQLLEVINIKKEIFIHYTVDYL